MASPTAIQPKNTTQLRTGISIMRYRQQSMPITGISDSLFQMVSTVMRVARM